MGSQLTERAKFATGRHFLIPFPRPEDLPTVSEFASSFIFDNWAFTAWKSGNPITDWQPYYEWCKAWARHPGFDWALIPDVIDGDEQDNNELIAEWEAKVWPSYASGVLGVPVWHMHESLDRLRLLCGRYRTVALGSSGEWPNPGTENWWRRMSDAMQFICDEHGRPPCKLHGLRMMNPEVFTHLPLASADSTNCAQNGNLHGKFGIYKPATVSQRWEVIAQRIERQNSPPVWRNGENQLPLFTLQ
jgi:hypothetical protein